MKLHKKLTGILCIISLLLTLIYVPATAVADISVTATTDNTVKQGSTASCYVYIESLENIAAMDVTVHFDPQKIKILSLYNTIDCKLYDNVKNTDNIQFNYIFDGKGEASKSQLFYFTYQVFSIAEASSTYFDITIGEAYDNDLKFVEILGSRTNFNITEAVTNKTCAVSSSYAVSTTIGEEFSLGYRLSTIEIASGATVINYNPELFEIVEIVEGGFLEGKIVDINTELLGAIYVSFVGTTYSNRYDFITVKLRTVKNVAEASTITFNSIEFYDKELNSLSCNECSTTVNISYNEAYIGDAPKMSVSAVYNAETEKVTASIHLEEMSRLGAGDFVLKFDSDALDFVSYNKEFEPDFFTVNDKELKDGIFKFSVISLNDIIESKKVISFTFDTILKCDVQTVLLDLSGSMITDSLTNKIPLNLVGSSLTLPEKHNYSADCDIKCNLCDSERETNNEHSFLKPDDKECSVCGYMRSVVNISIVSQPDKLSYLEAKDDLDLTGAKIEIEYNIGPSAVIDITDDMVSEFDNQKVLKQKIIVTYEDKTAYFYVDIIAKSLTHIEVTKLPDKLLYKNGESLDVNGMVITAYYNNGTSKVINADEYQIFEIEGLAPNARTVKIVYENASAEFDVTIVLALKGDVNGDDKIDTIDLATIKLFLAGLSELSDTGLLAGDLNEDGEINTVDLAILKLKLAGLE